jgi:transglutaminase/protease-like cytokinesis protein 3
LPNNQIRYLKTLSVLLLVILMSFYESKAQKINFVKVDKIVLKYPSEYTSIDSLAQRVLNDFSTPTEQVRAFYTWLISNISYDVDKTYARETQIAYLGRKDSLSRTHAVLGALAQLALEETKGICSGYTYLFHQLCLKAGIENYFITGYAKSGVMDLKTGPESLKHTWNVVKINEQLYFIDATWDAGHIVNQQFVKQNSYDYFLASPEEFALNHHPLLNKWLMIENERTLEEFLSAPIFFAAYRNSKYQLLEPYSLNGIIEQDANKLELTIKTKTKTSFIEIYNELMIEPKKVKTLKTTEENIYSVEIFMDEIKGNKLYLMDDNTSIVGFWIDSVE